MKEKRKIPSSLLGMILLIGVLGMPSFADAGRGHHGYHHHGYHHHGYRQHNGYAVIINQPRGYYKRSFYPPYAQSGYGYNYYPVPAPVYGYAPNVMLDIHTENGHFMIGY